MNDKETEIVNRLLAMDREGELENPALKRLAKRIKAGEGHFGTYSRLHHRHSRS